MPAKTSDQLLKEYDDACAEVARCLKAVAEEERKPRTSPAHDAFAKVRARKTEAAKAAAGAVMQRDAERLAAEQKARDEAQAKERAKIAEEFKAKGGVSLDATQIPVK